MKKTIKKLFAPRLSNILRQFDKAEQSLTNFIDMNAEKITKTENKLEVMERQQQRAYNVRRKMREFVSE